MKYIKKGLALFLAAAVMFACMPVMPAAAQAIELPAFVQKYSAQKPAVQLPVPQPA